MPVRKAKAYWNGDLKSGNGQVSFAGRFEQPYSFASRFENGAGSNPEELLGGALAGCFSMALSSNLSKAGFVPKHIQTDADVTIEKVGDGFKITRINLHTKADVPGIPAAKFQETAEATKKGCPVSQALTGTEIILDAKLG